MHETVQVLERCNIGVPSIPPRIEFYTARDGRRLAARVWRTEELPRARVVFLHGITSHGGWYGQVASYLATAGFDVHFLDRRGSGLNAQLPGDVDDWRTWIDDVFVYLDTSLTTDATRSQPRRLSNILCGISWGGKLARRWSDVMQHWSMHSPSSALASIRHFYQASSSVPFSLYPHKSAAEKAFAYSIASTGTIHRYAAVAGVYRAGPLSTA